jgi:GAF domain-containing protein
VPAVPAQPVPDGQPSRSLVNAFSEIAQHVHASTDPDESMRRITVAACEAIAGCDAASLSLITPDGPTTRAATGSLAVEGDLIQYAEREGPCLDAAMHERWLTTPDLRHDPRWPRSSVRMADELGVGSMVSCRLGLDAAPHCTLGGMNLYARRVGAFSEADEMMAILLSSLGAVVLDASRRQANLRAAIESRQVIGEAIGILKTQRHITSDEAFTLLSQASQRMNVKLRDLAHRIADDPPLPAGGAGSSPEADMIPPVAVRSLRGRV